MQDADQKPNEDTSEWADALQAPEAPQAKRQKPMLLTPFATTDERSKSGGSGSDDLDVPKPPSRFKKGVKRPDFWRLWDPAQRTRVMTYAFGALAVLALSFGGGWLGAAAHRDTGAVNITQQRVELKGEAEVVSSIAKNVGQSVVSVNVTSERESSNPYAGLFGFGGGGTRTQRSAGTGIILTSSGLIMTNRHVVPEGTTTVSVTLSDGTEYDDVTVVGRTKDTDTLDVAFLQIKDTKGKALVAAEIGDSAKMKVGDPVVAIGNALGQFQNTVTSGIISGYGRSLVASASDGSESENLENLFQTDAAINPGNSGGPLVNLDGQVIGLNTAVAGDSQGIGFAIPINDIAGLIDSVKTTGKVQRPYLGVVYLPITSDVVTQYKLSVDRGAYIPTPGEADGTDTVISGSPADKAGLKEQDIITKVDGVNVDESHSLTSLLGKHKVGDKVSLTIVRDGKTITKDVTLGTAPDS